MRQRFKIQFIALVLVAVSMVAVAARQSPDLTLRSLEGSDFKLGAKKGRVIALAFCAIGIPDADKRLPALQSLADQYSRHGMEFYWVSLDSTQPDNYNYASDEKLRDYAKQHGLRLPILRDPDAAAYRAFEIESAPTLILIGREGKIHSKHPNFFPGRIGVMEEITRTLNRLVK